MQQGARHVGGVRSSMSLKTARALFERFFDRAPKHEELLTVEMPKRIDGALIGKIKKLTYEPTGDDAFYEHQLAEGDEPALFISEDGQIFLPLGGSYEFTPHGFEG